MADRRAFDMSRLGAADRTILVAGVLYLVDSFLPWNRLCGSVLGVRACVSANLWHGVGILAVLVAIAVVVVVFLMVTGTTLPPGVAWPTLVAGGAAGVLVLSVLKILIDNEFLSYGAWIGLILAVAMAYGGYMKMQRVRPVGPEP